MHVARKCEMISPTDDVYRVSYQNGHVEYNRVPYLQEDINSKEIKPSSNKVSKRTMLSSRHSKLTIFI